MHYIEDIACDWRGHETGRSFSCRLIEVYKKEHPSLPIGLPPVLLDAWTDEHDGESYAESIFKDPVTLLNDLESIISLVDKSWIESSLASLTLLIEVAQRVRLRVLEVLCSGNVGGGIRLLNQLFALANRFLEQSTDRRRTKCTQEVSGLRDEVDGEKIGRLLLECTWACIPPRYTKFPTPSCLCRVTGIHKDLADILKRDLTIYETTEEIWNLIRARAVPEDDELAKMALLFVVSVYKTYVLNSPPAMVLGMFLEGHGNKWHGTIHKVFVTVAEKSTAGNVIYCPTGFSGETCFQAKTATTAALNTYLKRMEPVEVTVSIDDLPGGADLGIEVEGESLGLAAAVGLVSKLTGQRVDQNVAITGRLLVDGKTVRIRAVGGISQKVAGAESQGLTRVIVPLDNYSEAKLVCKQCDVVGVDTLAALINRIWVFDAHAHHILHEATKSSALTPITRSMTLYEFFSEELYRPQNIAPLKEDRFADTAKTQPLSDLLLDDNMPAQIILYGESGLGKTSALFYLLYQASHAGTADLQRSSVIPWFVRMRDFVKEGNGVSSFCATLSRRCPNHMQFDGNDIKRTLEDPNFPPLLILLDALNEIPAANQIETAKALKEFCNWLEDLNKKRHFGKHRVILTFRKEAYARSLVVQSLLLESGKEYELQRLSRKDVSDYLEHAVPNRDILKLFSADVKDLFTIPLFLFFATELAGFPEETLKAITNRALLYKEITQQWLRREWWDEKTKTFMPATEFDPDNRESLECCVDFHAKALGEIAYRMTEMGLTELPEEEIIKIIRSFVKNDLSRRSPKDFREDGPWQWLREYVSVFDVPSWAKEEGNGFSDFTQRMTRSLLKSTVLQGM